MDSNTMFNTSGMNDSSGSKYIQPGIENDVVISNVMGVVPQGGSPYIEFTFRKAASTNEDGSKIRFYMSEKSQPTSLKKILHIATKVVKRAQIDSLKATSVEEYGAMLSKLLSGKHLRMKFLGEEYRNSKDEVRVKPSIGLPDFAEAIMEGAEYTPVAQAASKLMFNSDKDIKRLAPTPSSDSTIVGDSTDDLPF